MSFNFPRNIGHVSVFELLCGGGLSLSLLFSFLALSFRFFLVREFKGWA